MSLRLSSVTVLAAFGLVWGVADADPLVLAPTLPATTSVVNGVHAQFRSVDPQAQFSTVYWSENSASPDCQGQVETGCYRNGAAAGFTRIGALSWGTGIWGLQDWQAVQSGAVASTRTFNGTVATINHGNAAFDQDWGSNWGMAAALPGSTPDENWAAWYGGYLRITEAGAYNFGVLYDDGFIFTLYGDNGQAASISSDFILGARDRLGFASDLILSEGLYRFELGAYNRLEAGVVQLAWTTPGSEDMTLVPDDHLVHVPLPGTLGLLAFGTLIGLRRKSGLRPARP